jgi:hypothetical protein
VNRAIAAQYSSDEREALDRVLVAFPGTTIGEFEPKDPSEPESVALLQEALEVLDEAIAESRSSWRSVDLREHLLPDDGSDAPELLRRSDGVGLLYGGKRNELHGPYESGKTWLALLAALEVLRRGDVVVWIDFEDSPRALAARLLSLGAGGDEIAASFRYLQPDEPLTAATEIDLRLELYGAALVVVDAANEAMAAAGLDPNANRDVAAWYATIPRLATQAGAAVVVLDHVAKDPERQRGAVGAGHKLAAVDGASYRVDAVVPFGRGGKGMLRLRLDKDRQGHIRGLLGSGMHPTAAEIGFDATDPDRLQAEIRPPSATAASADWRPTRLMELISEYLESRSDQVSMRVVLAAVAGKQEYKIAALEALVAGGFVQRSTGPRGASLHVSIRAFREGDR